MSSRFATSLAAALFLAAPSTRASDGLLFVERASLGGGDTDAGDKFGDSCDLAGDLLLVGAPEKNNGLAEDRGAAYVFVRVGAGWQQEAKLEAETPSSLDRFGHAVALHGQRALIGCPGDDAPGNDRGAAYVFDRSGTSWSAPIRLEASDTPVAAGFATALDLYGDRAAVGAPSVDGPSTNTGAVYVYERVGGAWIETAKLADPAAQIHDRMGTSVSLWDDALATGGLFADGNAINSGSAYIWREAGGVWSIEAELQAPDGQSNDFYGSHVALRGDLCVVGAYSHPAGVASGAAYVFQRQGGAWSFQQKLEAQGGANLVHFGRSLALDDGLLAVGTPFEATPIGMGTTHLFELGANGFEFIGRLGNGVNPLDGWFGASVAVDQGTVAVGSPQFNQGPGHAFVYEEASHELGTVACFGDGSGAACPCGNTGASGRGCGNSAAAQGTRLIGSGSPSISAGDFYLTACDLVPFQPALYFQGDELLNGGQGAAFGDGLRCVGTHIVRLQVRTATPDGSSSTSVGIAALGNAAPGDAKSYQCWSRDPGASPCGTTFNLSSALTVTYVP